jgi:uncharacterized protein YodC (DUF2158 family)
MFNTCIYAAIILLFSACSTRVPCRVFEKGTIVQLNSGGPPMTVIECHNESGDGVTTVWMNDLGDERYAFFYLWQLHASK